MERERPEFDASTEIDEARQSTPRSLREPPSPEEIKRRQKVLERILRRRLEMPPLEVPAGDLVRRARRQEADLDG